MAWRYAKLSVPTAILYGRDDAVLDPEVHGRLLSGAIAHAGLTIIDGGHMIPVTRPDETAAWIRRRAGAISPGR